MLLYKLKKSINNHHSLNVLKFCYKSFVCMYHFKILGFFPRPAMIFCNNLTFPGHYTTFSLIKNLSSTIIYYLNRITCEDDIIYQVAYFSISVQSTHSFNHNTYYSLCARYCSQFLKLVCTCNCYIVVFKA